LSSLVLILTIVAVCEGRIKPNGKAVLITGCDSGFGYQLSQKLNRNGFKVYATVHNSSSEGALALRGNATNADKLIVLQMDVTKDNDVNDVLQKVKQDLSSGYELWALVNNAGIGSYSPLEWGTMDRYHNVFEVNVFGLARVTRAFLPLIRKSKGRIINILSLFSRFSRKLSGIYAMSKHSALAFTDILRQEVSRFGVKVISIEPPYINTGLFTTEKLDNSLEKHFNQSINEVKLAYHHWDQEKKDTHILFDSPIIGQEMDPILEDINDSIVNLKPKANYSRIGPFYRIVLYLHLYFPTEFVDWVVETAMKFCEIYS